MSDLEIPSELETLKARADLMGISYRSNITVDLLKQKIADHKDKGTVKTETVDTSGNARVALEEARKESSKLVRVNISCMNPAKREWDGEIITSGNSTGTYKKYIPFNTPEGWYIPNIIYETLKQRKFQQFYNAKTDSGITIRKGRLIPEFNIEVLPNHTPEQLAEMALSQAARHAID